MHVLAEHRRGSIGSVPERASQYFRVPGVPDRRGRDIRDRGRPVPRRKGASGPSIAGCRMASEGGEKLGGVAGDGGVGFLREELADLTETRPGVVESFLVHGELGEFELD
jgi:hypothetical protein